MQVTGIVGAAILLATCAADGVGQVLTLTANPGTTPGIVMDAFEPQRAEGEAVSEVRVGANGQPTGTLNVQATCCWDVIRGRQVSLNNIVSPQGWTITGLPQAWTSTGLPHAVETVFPLKINARGSAGRPAMPYGKYLMQVAVSSQNGTLTPASTKIALTVLPDLKLFGRSCHTRLNTPGHAPAYFADSSTHVAVRALAQFVEQPPATEPGRPEPPLRFVIPGDARRRREGSKEFPSKGKEWRNGAWATLDVRDSDLPEDEAEVLFRDPGVKRTGSVEVGCLVPSANRKGPTALFTDGSMRINKATDPTLVIRMIECLRNLFGGCRPGLHNWVDIIILADEGFWDVFGGKQITVTWNDLT